MKKNLFFLILLIITINSFSQPIIRFNKTYTNVYAPLLRNILITDSGYVGLGFDYYSGKIQILIQKIDSFGNVLWIKHYGDTIYDYYHGTRNSLVKNANGDYSLAGSRENDTVNMCMLYKFDQNFDTLWTKRYFVDTNFTVFYNHIQTPDGGYALVGCYVKINNDGDVLLVKTDSLGNMQWYKTYGTTGSYSTDYGFCIVPTPDGGYLIGGSTKWSGEDDGYIIKTDSLGNKEWTRHYGNPAYPDGTIFSLIQTKDSGYVFNLSCYVTSPISNSFYYRRYNIIKLDKNFNEIWNKQYGTIAEYTGSGSIIETTDGDLVTTIEDDHICGLFKLSANGDSIWKKYYYPDYDYSQTGYGDGLLALKQTQDGGFVMAGVAYPPQRMWIVKVDSCGCDTAGCCNTGIPTYTLPTAKILIYPNPANDNLTLSINNAQLTINSVSILDITGKKVKSIKPKGQSSKYIVNVEDLPAGLYFIKIKTNNGEMMRKIVKQ